MVCVIFKGDLQLLIRDELDSAMFNEFRESFIKYVLSVLVSCFSVINSQGCNYFVLCHFEQKYELFSFSQELNRSDNHLKVFVFLG